MNLVVTAAIVVVVTVVVTAVLIADLPVADHGSGVAFGLMRCDVMRCDA